MGALQEIKRQLLPLIKGAHWIGIFAITALLMGKNKVKYSVPMYRSIAKIKLDDQKHGLSNNNLYTDFDIFSTEKKIDVEVEVLKSPLIISKALDKLNFETSYYRVGKIRTNPLYQEKPFLVSYQLEDKNLYDQQFNIRILSEDTYAIECLSIKQPISDTLNFSDTIKIGKSFIKLSLNKELLAAKDIHYKDQFYFVINSRYNLIYKQIIPKINITAMDKEVAVLRVVYESDSPQKSADFVNAICETYIEDYVGTKSNAAKTTLEFIDTQLIEIEAKLSRSENSLEKYKLENGVLNTRQESETGLREISNLEVQLINLKMNLNAVQSLEKQINENKYYDDMSINFGFGDLLMTELVKNLKLHNDEKKELLIKYKPEHEKILAINKKIEEVKTYVTRAITTSRIDLNNRIEEIEASILAEKKKYEHFPTREKDVHILEREFRLNESVYNFLSEKRIEASVAASSLIAFHRIIQRAEASSTPISPNATLVNFMSGLLGIILGIVFVYGRRYLYGKVNDRVDIEKKTTAECIGIVPKMKATEDSMDNFTSLALSLISRGYLQNKKEGICITVTSSVANEGKSFVARHLAKAFANMEYSTILINCNFKSDQTPQTDLGLTDIIKGDFSIDEIAQKDHFSELKKGISTVALTNVLSNKKWHTLLSKLKSSYDIILFDTDGSTIRQEPINLMLQSDLSLYIIKAQQTSSFMLNNIEHIKEEYKIKNVFTILNHAHRATNFNGIFTGSRFSYSNKPKSLIGLIQHYYNYYLR